MNDNNYRSRLKIFLVFGLLFQMGFIVSAQTILLKDAFVIDVDKGFISKPMDILCEHGKIIRIEKNISVEKPTKIISCEGKYVMPGLIDAHIHLFQSGGLYTRPDGLDLTDFVAYEDERKWLKENAEDILQRYLAAGITTVVDVGGPFYQYQLRDSLNLKNTNAKVFLTGPLVSTYQPDAFQIDDTPIQKVNSEKEARSLVQKQIPFAPDFIKIWYIAITPQQALDDFNIIKATIDESHKNNVRVAVHATQLATAKLAIKAGADFLVHSVDDVAIDDEFVRLLVDNQVEYIPSLVVGSNYTRVFTQDYKPSEEDYIYAPPIPLGSTQDLLHLDAPKRIEQLMAYAAYMKEEDEKSEIIKANNLKKLWAAGANIATGTDAGNVGTMHASSYFDEIRAMSKAGLSNKQIIKASTINGAKVLNAEHHLGLIKEGYTSDILVLNSDPLQNIMNIKDIAHVIHEDHITTPQNILEDVSPEDLVQMQLNAYNMHDLEAFLVPYADDVKIYEFPNTLLSQGKDRMRQDYQFIEQAPDLHCELVNRIVQGNTVIDQESVIFSKNQGKLHAIAIYKIKGQKISEVYFIQ